MSTVPQHVSIIMDGNGRWAKSRGLDRSAGHVEGVNSVRTILKAAARHGVKYLSLYAFSEENWNRSDTEVASLMALMLKSMLEEITRMLDEDVRFVVLGNRERLGAELNKTIDDCMERTKDNSRITMVIFLSYSGKWDIFQAAKRFAMDVVANPSLMDSATIDTFGSYLVTSDIPDPDLIIRTSGEQRISNYLLWQAAYSEFYYTDVLWPDFREEEFAKALEAYAKRDRRYGKTK